jgi:MoaA/NifB/PqqE/SkfB family radical SAM enzyme
MNRSVYRKADFARSPLLVFYETTRACDLKCQHCRADAQTRCDPNELSAGQARRLVDELLRFPRPPLLVLTGGDPIKRTDIFDLVGYAVTSGLEVALTPSATPLVTAGAVRRLKRAGLHRLAVSLDGGDAATHDGFRGVAGSFTRTFEIVADARAVGLPVQVNTTVARHNLHQVEAIAELLSGLGVELWSVFFLVPTGRAGAGQRLTADECERVFEALWRQQRLRPYAIKTTEAPHYRRFVLQRRREAGGSGVGRPSRAPVGTNDGKGVLFVSHTGEICPSGFLPIVCGRFPLDSVVKVYQESAAFRALRDADRLGGKCGACEFKEICGGSRGRAHALSGDPLAEEPDCAYVPPRWAAAREERQSCSA